MQIIRDEVKREYENKMVRISKIVDALEWLGNPSHSSISTPEAELHLKVLADSKNGEIEEAIKNFVFDLTVAAVIGKLVYPALRGAESGRIVNAEKGD
jgi:hypothetical protein